MANSLSARSRMFAAGIPRWSPRVRRAAVLAAVLFTAAVLGLTVAWAVARAAWNAELVAYRAAVTEARKNAVASLSAATPNHADAAERLNGLVAEARALHAANSEGAATEDARFGLLLAIRDAEAAARLPLTLTTERLQVDGIEATWPLRDSRPVVAVEVVARADPSPDYFAEFEQRLQTAMDALTAGAGG